MQSKTTERPCHKKVESKGQHPRLFSDLHTYAVAYVSYIHTYVHVHTYMGTDECTHTKRKNERKEGTKEKQLLSGCCTSLRVNLVPLIRSLQRLKELGDRALDTTLRKACLM